MPERATASEREGEARAFLAASKSLRKVKSFDLVRDFRLPWLVADKMLDRAQLDRGEITLADIPPHRRRGLVDPAKLDLHAIAAGPIMDSNQLYLPAGRISAAKATAREAANVQVESRESADG